MSLMSNRYRDDGTLRSADRVLAGFAFAFTLLLCLALWLVETARIFDGRSQDRMSMVICSVFSFVILYITGYPAFVGRDPRWLVWILYRTWGRWLGEREPRWLRDRSAASTSAGKGRTDE